MPHIEIKCFPGRTEEQKALLANKLAEDAAEILGSKIKNISVVIQDVPKERLNEARFSNIFIEKRASTCPQSLEKSRLFSYALLVSECENFQNMKRIFLRKVVI